MWPKSYYSKLKRMTNVGRSLFRIERRLLNTELDLHLVGQTLGLCIQSGVEEDVSEPHWDPRALAELAFLRHVVSRLDIDQQTIPNFASALELRTSLRRVDLVAGRASYATGSGVIKIPGRQISAYGSRIRKLTDWPQFQRLRGIKQLGFTYLVYPGAVHTRFEHSLGVFQNTVEVLDNIAGQYGDLRFRSVVTDEELIGTVVAGLMHDIGHYPFAHQFRLKGIFPRHEERSLQLLDSKPCKTLVIHNIGVDAHKAAVQVLEAVLAHESPADTEESRAARVSKLPKHFQVLRTILSSPIDVDKLDYVYRDAYHANVPYGRIVDTGRFLQSLKVWWAPDASPHLLLSDKGRVCAEALIFARYQMTSEVYWNHAVRAYAAMLSAAVV